MEPWGKWSHEDSGKPFPLIAHLLDTAAVSAVLWSHWISRPIRELISPLFGDDPRGGFALLAGAHDLGKLDPLFQGQLLSAGSQRQEFGEYLKELGLPLPDGALVREFTCYDQPRRAHLRHEALSAHVLEQQQTPQWACASVAGHHGRYQPDLSPVQTARIGEHRRTLDGNEWSDLQQRHLSILSDALGTSVGAYQERLAPKHGATIPLLTGLVVLADWMASDESFVSSAPLEKLDGDPRSYLESRRAHAEESLDRHLGRPVQKGGQFNELFAFEPDRPVQQWADTATHGPGLTVVTVPTGEGKTETALWIHAARTDLEEGLMFALPTTATADAMFDRVRDFYAGTDSLAHLAHGRAILNAFYAESDVRPTSICDEDNPEAVPGVTLRPSSWFSGRHRGLTAPITIGTCDQVLAASLSHKYLPIRLAALANKHVILDEVHTYDPYQQRLLVRLLGWLGFFRSRVTLLSATLPVQRLNECMNAYRNGWNRFDEDAIAADDELVKNAYPSVVRTTPEGGVETIELTAHRTYTHEITVRTTSGAGEEFNATTAELVHGHWQAGEHQRIGLIVNTVDRAQQVARLLRLMDHDVLLLHSRMTADQRSSATRSLMDKCGKTSGPGPVLLVSTQIAEASLDIDLDLLITDLAPMASLIQRFGRQWRHSTPHVDGTWEHPSHLQYRSGNPRAIVLVPMGDDKQLHPRGHYPYTRAEMNKTLRESAALDGGERTRLRVPEDIQCAVDAANVSWDDLVEIDDESVAELTEHLAGSSTAAQMAKLAGVDAGTLANNWRGNGSWEASDTLHQLTVGTLWNEEAVTRLRDGEALQVLVCDPSGTIPGAWQGSIESVLDVSGRTQIIKILGHVIPVSGALAKKLREAATPFVPAAWVEHRSPLIRSLVPVPVGSLAGIAELTVDGLVKSEKGNR